MKTESERRYAILALSAFVQTFIEAGVKDTRSFNEWKKNKKNVAYMANAFSYPSDHGLPSITGLVKPFFHDTLPLVGLNYTQLAHNTLHEFPQGWTTALRLCRGIVFNHQGDLVAMPFPKFFNFGEHPETVNLPTMSAHLEATDKQDGHLGIIFKYGNDFILTTRGSFNSPTAKFANRMLAQYVKRNNWKENFPAGLTLLTEIIHPETKVYVDYGEVKEFRIIGAFTPGANPIQDWNHDQLVILGTELGLSVTPIWEGRNLKDLVALMRDRSVHNKEGFVVRFQDGLDVLRVKFKFENYIGLMVQDKLSPAYLMQRIISGNLEKMLLTLPEEIYSIALNMLGEIMLRVSAPGKLQDKWRRLYDLPHTTKDPSFQDVCRKFVKSFIATA